MTLFEIPTLRTARLVLRAFRADDFEAYAAVRAAPEVARYTGGRPLTPAEAWTSMAVGLGQWALRGYGLFAVALDTGHVIGHAGMLHHLDWPEPELAYALHPANWGRGYATEAAAAVRDWFFANQGAEQAASFIDPANTRSARVAAKLGAVNHGPMPLRVFVVDRWVHYRPGSGPTV
jgi:RimJ/RimL family protein N-acetyltransferase